MAFSREPSKKRPAERKKNVITVRPPKDVEEYILEMLEGGHGKTEVVLKALRFLRDTSHRLDAEWFELEKRAYADRVSVGTKAGDLLATLLVPGKTPRA